jgi:hypothetical protein
VIVPIDLSPVVMNLLPLVAYLILIFARFALVALADLVMTSISQLLQLSLVVTQSFTLPVIAGGLSSAYARTLGTIKEAASKLTDMMDVDFFMVPPFPCTAPEKTQAPYQGPNSEILRTCTQVQSRPTGFFCWRLENFIRPNRVTLVIEMRPLRFTVQAGYARLG